MASLIVVVIITVPAYIVATILNKKLIAAGCKPFNWGYYQSCMLLAASLGFLIYYVDYTQNTYYSGPSDFLFFIIFETIIIASSILNFRRYRIGAIAVTILNLNPLSW